MLEAKQLLEYGVDCRTHITTHYTLLAKIYKDQHNTEHIHDLIEVASSLKTIKRAAIIKALKEQLN